MYKLLLSNRFKKSFRLCVKRGLDPKRYEEVARQLQATGKVDAKHRPHKLSGNLDGVWECHIQPDWLLIWVQNDRELTLLMVDTGTHSDLFKK